MEHTHLNDQRRQGGLSFTCFVFCLIMLLLFGLLPALPDQITRIFRPVFIGISILSLSKSRYYRLGASSFQLVTFLYFIGIFFSFPITSTSIETFISASLFIFFFLFSASRVWSRKEIIWILIILVVACDIEAIILHLSNPGFFHSEGSAKLKFLNAAINRNTPAYALVPGALCSAVFLVFDRKIYHTPEYYFFLISALLCTFTVFALGCRGAFLSYAIGMVVILIQKNREEQDIQKRRDKRILAFLLLILLVVLAAVFASGTVSERLFSFDGEIDDSGRRQIWKIAWELIKMKPVFGGGFDYWVNNGIEIGTHNSFITYMLWSGWIGGILLGLFFLSSIHSVLMCRNLIPLAFLAEAIVHSMSESLVDYFAYVPLILAFILMHYYSLYQCRTGRLFEMPRFWRE